MLSFFTALFGGAYLLGKSFKEESNKQRADAESRAYEKKYDYYFEMLSPPEGFYRMVDECVYYCDYSDDVMCEGVANNGKECRLTGKDVKQILDSELREIFGDDFEKEYPLPGSDYFTEIDRHGEITTHEENIDAAKYLVLSCFGWFGHGTTWTPLPKWRSEIWENKDLRVWKRIAANLKKYANIPVTLILEKHNDVFTGSPNPWRFQYCTIHIEELYIHVSYSQYRRLCDVEV